MRPGHDAKRSRECKAISHGRIVSLLIILFILWPVKLGAAVSVPDRLFQSIHLSGVLTLGQLVECETKGGESRFFQIKLAERQYLRVLVEQEGADVQLALRGPDGKKLAETSLPFGSIGPEVISIVSRRAGGHWLEIIPANRVINGRYTVVIEELRAASAQDQQRTTTERAYYHGGGICFHGSLDAVEHALVRCERMAATAADPREQSLGLHRRALVEATLGKREDAIQSLGQELALWRTMGDRAEQMATLEGIGALYSEFDADQAMSFYQASLKLRQGSGDRLGLAWILRDMGLVHSKRGDKAQALALFQQSLEIHQQLGNRLGEATLLNTLGTIHHQLDDNRRSIEYHERSLEIWRAMGDKRGEAATLSYLCRGYNSPEGRGRALEYCQQALPMLRASGDRRAEAGVLNTLGMIYFNVDDFRNALSYFEQSLQLFRTLGDRRKEAVALTQIAQLHERQGDTQRTMEIYRQALAYARRTGETWREAQSLKHIGALHYSRGEREEARECFERSLALSRAAGYRDNEAGVLHLLARLALDGGDRKTARDYLNRAIDYRRSTGEKALEARLLFTLAEVERAGGNPNAALTLIADSISIAESVRACIGVEEWRGSYFAAVQGMYEFQVDLLMQLHRRHPDRAYGAAALETAERARARLLLEMLIEAKVGIREGVEPALLARERELRERLTAASSRLLRMLQGTPSSGQTIEARSETRIEIETLAGQLQQTRTQIRQRSPRYAAFIEPRPITLTEMQSKLLDRDSLLLEYSLGKTRSYLWAVTGDSLTSYELPGRAQIESAARRLYGLLTARNQRLKFEAPDEKRSRVAEADAEFPAAAATLSQMLLAPVASKLKKQRLLIVADGALQYLPFAAFPDPAPGENTSANQPPATNHQPLIVNHEIVSLPSASSLVLLREGLADRPLAPKTVAVIADPVFDRADERLAAAGLGRKPASFASPFAGKAATRDGGANAEMLRAAKETGLVDECLTLPRLPFTRKEARAILALAPIPERKEALDFAASHAAITSDELKDFRYIHIATHGMVNSQYPELSGLIFSLVDETGQPRDGFLRAQEIYNLKLPAELVVLSACRTGLGKEIKGEGLVGLTRGFMYAGAARVMVSLWDVNDQATSVLMTRLYQGMLGKEHLSPAAALRAAQVALWKEKGWQAPYYWASFVLQGEPR